MFSVWCELHCIWLCCIDVNVYDTKEEGARKREEEKAAHERNSEFYDRENVYVIATIYCALFLACVKKLIFSHADGNFLIGVHFQFSN